MSPRKILLLVVAAAVAVSVAAVIVSSSSSDKAAKAPSRAQSSQLFAGIPQRGDTLGRPDAPVTLVEFADLQCPYCRDFAHAQLPGIVERYVRPGKVRLVFRNFAFLGPDSETAARVAEAAALQGKQSEFVHRFYAEQGTENTGYVTEDFLRKVAGQVGGLDVDRALQQADSSQVAARLARDQAAVRRAGVQGTPTFLLDGKLLSADQVGPALAEATA